MKTRIVMLAALTVVLLLSVVPAVSAQEATSVDTGRQPVVVLVDMSGSLSEGDLHEEVRAVNLLSTFETTDVFVLGFASEGSKRAWEIFCEPGDDLAECTADIERRTEAEGNDTDHASALSAAALVLNRPDVADGPPGVVLIMTDGKYDPNGEGATDEDLSRLETARGELEAVGAQVWPLGFGAASQADLDRLALAGPQSCSAPKGVIAKGDDQIGEALAEILANATCSGEIDNGELEVPDRSRVTIWYNDDDEVTITGESGESRTFACEFNEGADVWECTMTTEDVDPGTWTIDPPPRDYPPVITPLDPPTSTPSTTLAPVVPTSTTQAPGATQPPADTTPPTTPADGAGEEGSGGFPWWILLLVLAAAGVVALMYLLTRPKLARGYLVVRKDGGEWSPEETVRAERRQAFEMEADGPYPSITRTAGAAPDVILEASSKGTYLSGSMVPNKRLIRLAEEVEIGDGVTLMYSTTSLGDADDYDDFEDDFDDDYGDQDNDLI